ncbi:VAMP5 protein, partial [Chaetorhynchus papuensis]|nr:VAMP5 protein [Chaetorhynchus papuensis]
TGDTGPAGLGMPGAGPGAPLGLSVPKGGTQPPGAVGGGPRGTFRVPVSRPRVSRVFPAVPRYPLTPQCSCPPGPHPQVTPCPRPHGFLSPWSLCPPPPPPPPPLSLRCPCPHGQGVSLGISPVSPRCPHIVPPCPQAGLARCHREAEEVAELMRQNVAKALEREGRLEQLQSRAQDLRQASEAFTRTTQTVTRRQRRRQRRWHLVALGLGLLLLFILALALALALARPSPGTVTSTVPTPRGETKHPPSTAGAL